MQAPGTGPRIELTLDDAIARALERNLDLAVQRLNPQVFDLTLAQQLAAYRPTFDTAFSNNSRTNPSSTQLDGGESVVQRHRDPEYRRESGRRLGRRQLPAQLQQQPVRRRRISSPASTPAIARTSRPPIRSRCSGDSGSIRPRQQIQVTRINRDIADIDLRQTITNTVSAVRDAYWELVYATQTVAVQQQALELAEALVRDNEARVEIGTLAPIDVVQALSEAAGPPADARAGRAGAGDGRAGLEATDRRRHQRRVLAGIAEPHRSPDPRSGADRPRRDHPQGSRGTNRPRAIAPPARHQRSESLVDAQPEAALARPHGQLPVAGAGRGRVSCARDSAARC